MTLDELNLLHDLITIYVPHEIKTREAALFVINRDIKLKVNDPRIFAKDRKDEH